MNYFDIIAAVAQAWCKPETENKVMDPVLAHAVVENIEKLLNSAGIFVVRDWSYTAPKDTRASEVIKRLRAMGIVV
jgi:hypothetical protein